MNTDIEEMDDRIKRVLDKVDEVVYNPTAYPFNRHGGLYELGYRDGIMRVEFWLRQEFDPIYKSAMERISQRGREHDVSRETLKEKNNAQHRIQNL